LMHGVSRVTFAPWPQVQAVGSVRGARTPACRAHTHVGACASNAMRNPGYGRRLRIFDYPNGRSRSAIAIRKNMERPAAETTSDRVCAKQEGFTAETTGQAD